MKHLKMIGLALMAAAALMASASSASATVLTSPANTEYTGEIDMSLTESLFLKASVFNVTCSKATVIAAGAKWTGKYTVTTPDTLIVD
jgi:poly(3-hydroxyalkanoate) synthetase